MIAQKRVDQSLRHIDKRDMLMLSILPEMVVCGQTKDNYKLNCYPGGVRSISAEHALDYPYVRYGTTFERHDQPHPEVIKCFIIDVDYKFKPTLQEAHDFVTDNIIPPTFTTQTTKGYQFIIGLASAFFLTDAGRSHAENINHSIIEKFTEQGINVDMGASNRLIGTYRNPLVHNHKWHNKLYNVDEIGKYIGTARKAVRSQPTPQKTAITAINSKAIDQAKVIETGYVEGNRNQYFYLLSNKDVVEGRVSSFEETLMICRSVADQIGGIPNSEIRATAKQLWKYRKENRLFMPRVFCTGKGKANAGKYRNELNATVGYASITDRRSASMKLVHRDRKLKTAEMISNAVKEVDLETFSQSRKKVIAEISKKSGLGESTVKRHLKETPALLSSKLSNKYTKKKRYVLDYLTPPLFTGFAGEMKENVRLALGDLGDHVEITATEDEIVIDFDTDQPPDNAENRQKRSKAQR